MKSFNKMVAMLLLAVSFSAGAVVEFKKSEFLAATTEKQTEIAQTLLDNAKKEFPKTYGAEIAKIAVLDVEKLTEACEGWAIENLTPEILKAEILKANPTWATTAKIGFGKIGNFCAAPFRAAWNNKKTSAVVGTVLTGGVLLTKKLLTKNTAVKPSFFANNKGKLEILGGTGLISGGIGGAYKLGYLTPANLTSTLTSAKDLAITCFDKIGSFFDNR